MTDETGTTTSGYNLASELTTIDGPWENDTITLSYDALGRASGRSINNAGANTLVYDDYGRPQSVTNPLDTFTYNYPTVISTLVESITASAGPSTSFAYYDATGDYRLKDIWHKNAAGETISRFGYDYDVLGTIRRWTQQAGIAPAQAFTFDYDPVEQLKSAILADAGGIALKSYSYDYDRAGNRIGEAIELAITKEVPNNLNQLMTRQGGAGVLPIRGRTDELASVTVNGKPAETKADNSFEARIDVVAGSNPVTVVATDVKGNTITNHYDLVATGSGTESLIYDLNGNLTSDGTRTFEWDPLDRLTAINTATGRSEFEYDGLSRRVRIVEMESRAVISDKRFIWSGTTLAEERDSSLGTVAKRFFGQGTQMLSEGNGGIYLYARDHLDSIREMTDLDGNLHARYDYDLDGVRTKLAGDRDADVGYTGHYYHHASGLIMAPYRIFDPVKARWISRDPIGEQGGINLYGYVQNNSVNRIDSLGLTDTDPYGFDEAETLGTMGSQRGKDIAEKAPAIVKDTVIDGLTDIVLGSLPTDAILGTVFKVGENLIRMTQWGGQAVARGFVW